MKVSVVIPAHNEESALPHSLHAVLNQDYDNYEVIVVNNASSDSTADVASEFPVKLVHENRKGLLWAREAGRRAASGDIIANMDADCLPHSSWISTAVKHFDSPHIVAVTGPYDYHDGGTLFRHTSLLGQKYLYSFMSNLLQLPFIRKGAVLIGGNTFIRKDILDSAGGYNTSLTFYGEDTDTAKRLYKYGRIKFVCSLPIRTSARRMKAEGTLRLTLRYWKYFFKHIFT